MSFDDHEDPIYSSVPDEHIEKVDPQKKQAILDMLKAKPGEFYYAKVIAQKCGFPIKGSYVEVRKAIVELNMDGHPIVGNPKGFAYATCSSMVLFYADALEARLKGVQRRIDTVREIGAIMQMKGK